MLLVGSSRAELATLINFIRQLAVIVGGAGILLGVFMSVWFSARVTRPLAKLATGAREVAAGDWAVRVDARSRDEVGQLARDFNEMTRQLAEQRDRLVQAERVAAWREIARRLAHELKNPLFPLQLTLENLQRARQQTPEQFDEIFKESTWTLRAELDNLKTIVTRFSDFSKMPAPQFQPTNLNDAVRNAVRVYDAQFNVIGRPPVTPELYLDESMPVIQADPGFAASRAEQSGAEFAGRDAFRRNADGANRAQRRYGARGDFGYRRRADFRRMREIIYAVLHDEAHGYRAGTGDCAVGGERSFRENFGGERSGTWRDIPD